MPAPDWENLDDFLDAEEFAVQAVIELQDATSRTVTGIYDDPYLNAELGEYDMDTSRPRFTCKETDVQGVTRGDTISIDGTVMDIMTSPQPDGTGVALLDLAPRG